MANRLYKPSYAGFTCLYFAYNAGAMTSTTIDVNCYWENPDDFMASGVAQPLDDQSLAVDLFNWLNMLDLMKNDYETGAITDPLNLLDCFGLSMSDLMSLMTGG
jgi:hypothetical protein